MAVAVTEIPGAGPVVPHTDGDDWEIRAALTFTGNYVAGGEVSFKAAVEAILKQLGVGVIDMVIVNGVPGYVVMYNYETGNLMVYEGAAGALKEIAAAAYPAAVLGAKARVWIAGR